MENENPTIAILGAGPIGIEAALYARFLGYPVKVFERGELLNSVRRWAHVTLFSPFGMNCSALGRQALQAHNPDHVLPADDAQHTAGQWIDQYLQPLAETDLLAGRILCKSQVVGIGRDRYAESFDAEKYQSFRLVVETDGQEQIHNADIVIDASGTWSRPNFTGIGGAPAIGERQARAATSPDNLFTDHILTSQELENASGHFLLVGRGYSAATNLLMLDQQRANGKDITCTWVTRGTASDQGPLSLIENDSLPYRHELASKANHLATADWVDWRAECEVAKFAFQDGVYSVQLSDSHELNVQHVLSNTGYMGDYEMLQALHLHRCYVSGGPMAWAASVAGTGGDCLQQTSTGPDALKTTEKNFYILGSKSYARDSRFLFATGLKQIRDVFKLIGERETLDLYQGFASTNSNG